MVNWSAVTHMKPALSRLKRYIKAGIQQARGQNPYHGPALASMTLDEDDLEIAQQWLEKPSCWYALEPVREYEQQFAAWNKSRYAFAFMGGRVALSAAIDALGLQPGDEVIVAAYTCIVVPNAFHFAGVRVVYADIELDTYGLDASALTQLIGPKTRALLIQHLYGLVCRDYEILLEIAQKHNLYVIEDCAHSAGATYRGIPVGNAGDIAFYSSEQSKVWNTVQGGIATTNNDKIAERLQAYVRTCPDPDEDFIRKQLNNVALNYYLFKNPASPEARITIRALRKQRLQSTTDEELQGKRPAHYGARMPAAIAVIGLNQLRKLDHYNQLRRATAGRWDRWCDEMSYQRPLVIEGSEPIYLRYPVLVEPEKKRDLSWAVQQLGVRPGVWFISHTHPVHIKLDGYLNARQAIARCINLPSIIP